MDNHGGGAGPGKNISPDPRLDMLEKNLESEHVSEYRKHTGRLWRETRWAIIFSVTLFALIPVRLAGQTASSGALGSPQAPQYGSSAQTPLQFAGETVRGNQVSLSMGASALYDDNVLGSNSDRLDDEALSFDSNFGISRQTEHLTFNFGYTPNFMLYRQITQYDRLNHSANLSLSYRLSARFSLDLSDTFSYQNGIYPSLTDGQILSGPVSPMALTTLKSLMISLISYMNDDKDHGVGTIHPAPSVAHRKKLAVDSHKHLLSEPIVQTLSPPNFVLN